MCNKKRGLQVADMAKSSWVYKTAGDFRAGIGRDRSAAGGASAASRCTVSGTQEWQNHYNIRMA
jgi:hypothetical protein